MCSSARLQPALLLAKAVWWPGGRVYKRDFLCHLNVCSSQFLRCIRNYFPAVKLWHSFDLQAVRFAKEEKLVLQKHHLAGLFNTPRHWISLNQSLWVLSSWFYRSGPVVTEDHSCFLMECGHSSFYRSGLTGTKNHFCFRGWGFAWTVTRLSHIHTSWDLMFWILGNNSPSRSFLHCPGA